MTEALTRRAAELLGTSAVHVVVGYRRGRRSNLPVPHFARTAGEVSEFILDANCKGGLAVFAPREAANAPAAFVATRDDIRALKILVQEKQVPGENVRLIAFEVDTAGAATLLDGGRLEDFPEVSPSPSPSEAAEIARLKAATPAQRWRYWRDQFDKCIRCYACRAACPMCYCQECIADRNLPQWVDAAPRPRGNFAWNFIRAWHLAGRCVECRACERACPQGIKLMLLNRMIADEISQDFGYLAGAGSPEDAAFFAAFKDNDNDAFILGK